MPGKKLLRWSLVGLLLLLLAAIFVYNLPPVKQRLDWRLDFALTYLRGLVNPVGAPPTPLPQPHMAVTSQPTATPSPLPLTPFPSTPALTPTSLPPTLTPTPLPASVALPAPAWERQDINNCGPATLSMYLKYWGWEGDQFAIAELLKPQREDRNVNVEELVYFVRTRAGWLHAQYRVGGDIDLLKKLLAAGLPVVIEETFHFEDPFWPNDDLWAAHYNLLTGYDDTLQAFTGQDSFYGSDKLITYQKLDENWQPFNRVYILVYPPEKEAEVQSILGPAWDESANRQRALESAQAETQADEQDAYAWFNQGTNLVYFERYDEAAAAFDRAREIGLPQRMLRYQFTPFFAYFHALRTEDLLGLTEYALKITPNAEEALLWHGWGLYRQGDSAAAIASFQQALVENANYADAAYALNYVRENP